MHEKAEQQKLRKHRRLVDVMDDFETLATKDPQLRRRREHRMTTLKNNLDQLRAKADAVMTRRQGATPATIN